MPKNAHRRPEVFISATSADLRTCRQLVKEALLTLGCTPIEQTNFSPSATTVHEMLRKILVTCDAVVHIVGLYYGAEPQERNVNDPRRSYTQLEYELAREMGKPVYVFVCGNGFPYDEHNSENEERRTLQLEHRARIQQGDRLFSLIADRTDLSLRVHSLQTKFETLSANIKKSRSWLTNGVVVKVVIACVLGVSVWQLKQHANKTDKNTVKIEIAMDEQRRYIQTVADAFIQQKGSWIN